MSTDNQGYEMTMNALREAALIRSAREHVRSECLTDNTLIAFADGRLSDVELRQWTPHLSRCRRCQHELASLVRVLNDPDVMQASRADDRAPSRLPGILFPLMAAAAAIIVFVVRPERQLTPPVEVRHRAPVLTPAAAPVGVSPVGPVADATDLRWSSVSHADLYRVTLFDADGRTLFEAEGSETEMTLPDSVKLSPARRYLWQVQARIGFDRWVSSDLVEFHVVPPAP